ncbi:MAG: PAS domain S-box protein [bacterium]|nr:PAS domain S-box protein [bacterium]
MQLAQVKMLFDHMPELVAVSGSTHEEILYINPAGAQMLGIDVSKLKDTSVFNIFHPAYRDIIAEKISDAMEKSLPTGKMEAVLTGKDNGKLLANVSINHTRFKRKDAFLLFGRDITKDIRNQVQPSREEPAWKYLVESLPASVCIRTGNKIAYMNQEALKCTGYLRDDIVGKDISDFMVDEDHDLFELETEKVLSEKTKRCIPELRLRMSNGDVVLCEVISLYIEYKGKPSIIFIGRDVSARKQEKEKTLQSLLRLLSIKEKEYLLLMASGLNRKEISRRMDIQVETGDTYKKRIKSKLKGEKKIEDVARYVSELLVIENHIQTGTQYRDRALV